MIVADLLGPAGGESEQISGGGSVRDRYLVGALAPMGVVAVDADRQTDPGIDGDDSIDEPEIEQPAARPALHPSSIGFTCVVDAAADQLVAEGSWGRYQRERPQAEGGDGREARGRVWQRYPMSGRVEVRLAEGAFGPLTVTADQPDVVVRGLITRQGDAWLASLFLVNEQEPQDRLRDEAWLFQAKLAAWAPSRDHVDGGPLFVGRRTVLGSFAEARDDEGELAALDLQYRNYVEFAVGHGVSVHVTIDGNGTDRRDPTRAVRIETSVIPAFDVPRTEAPTAKEEPALAGAMLDMGDLARLDRSAVDGALRPLVDAYRDWIGRQRARLEAGRDRLRDHQVAAERALATAEQVAGRIEAGIQLLADPNAPDALAAFRFANEAMWQQRIRTTAIEARRVQPALSEADALTAADVPGNRSWRPFQLAFILLNLPSLTDPRHRERSRSAALVDLLFFPTGGGKTEAYLGLTAYTFAIRRLQGETGGRDGSGGVAVLMRYTLRLLTAQQFQRAAALVCACEVLRRERTKNDPRWGETPFRIGLWVGSALTPNRNRDAQRALEEQREGHGTTRSQPVQLTGCPWCGRELNAGRDAKPDELRWRTLLFCSDAMGECPFTEAPSEREGIPVVTVDEELYRLLPALVIATADKFAQLPLQGPLHMLFGRVRRRCTRHGYRSADLDDYTGREERDSHNKMRDLPKATTVDCVPLRPPDLIIQDELHLMSGPLGTLVGLYETAIDHLATWELDGQPVRPKVVASTATIRRAAEQVHALFWRGLAVFPPPVLDAEDSFFARQRPPAEKPGRRYLGVCAAGQRLVSAEVRIFTAVLASAQRLFERWGTAADPWMTMVGYFNSLRELGGARRFIEDDVRSRLRVADRRGLSRRTRMLLRELTSRVPSSEITPILDELNRRFDPDAPEDAPHPVDIVLATNMISVGVDVQRLGLMVAVGQPKATAEYIQATSRVGRSEDGPGLVITLYNWFRPRDLSHYETFEHYHATFYRQVEALSVTPFSPRALDRALTAVLVAILRHHCEEIATWNPNDGAQRVKTSGHPIVAAIIEEIAQRGEDVSGKPETADLIRDALRYRLDSWGQRQSTAAAGGAVLGYQQKATTAALLEPPTLGEWSLWAVPNSLREAEPTVNLIIRTEDDSFREAPAWKLGSGKKAASVGKTAEDRPADESPDVTATE
jgi:hypothetical protein